MSVSVRRSQQVRGKVVGTELYFYEIDNIDIDDQMKAHRRKGYGNVVTTGTAIRSLWASERICLFLDGGSLKRLDSDNTSTTLLSGFDYTDTVSYVEVGNYVYFSSSNMVGYIDTRVGTTTSFPDPAQTYKTRMVGGQILEYHYNRLYAANGNNLFFSDPTILTRMDQRKNAMAFPSRITMLKSVLDGMYVSDSERVYFLAGRAPADFVSRDVLDVPAIEGMSVSTMVRKRKNPVKTVFFLTKKGMYEGYPEGILIPQQGGLFNISNLDSGTAIIKEGSYQQYVGIGITKASIGISSGDYNPTVITYTGTSS
jgi:hypothetical protein